MCVWVSRFIVLRSCLNSFFCHQDDIRGAQREIHDTLNFSLSSLPLLTNTLSIKPSSEKFDNQSSLSCYVRSSTPTPWCYWCCLTFKIPLTQRWTISGRRWWQQADYLPNIQGSWSYNELYLNYYFFSLVCFATPWTDLRRENERKKKKEMKKKLEYSRISEDIRCVLVVYKWAFWRILMINWSCFSTHVDSFFFLYEAAE